MIPAHQFIILAICYGLLFLLCLGVWKLKSDNPASQKVMNGNWLLLHLRHGGGLIITGVLPAIYLPYTPKDIWTGTGPVSMIQALSLSATALLLVAAVVLNRNGMPARKEVVDRPAFLNVWIHLLLRSSFLVAYEWFFRGCLLFSCISRFGVPKAIIINLLLYAFIHSFNGKKEFYGSVPFGLILCLFTIWNQSVWPAVLLHLLLSSTHEFFLLPDFIKKTKPIV